MNASDADEQITLRIPAVTKHIRVARTAAASMAADIDFSADRIEELRIAVDEIISLLVDASPLGASGAAATVDITFRIVAGDCIEMHASIADGSIGTVPSITEQIIRAVADDVRIEDRSGWFSMQNVP